MAIKVSGTTVIDDNRNLKNSVNLNAAGNVYANTFIGDGSQLTNLPPSGGTVTATASGTLSDGSAVVVNADGTVSVIADDATNVSESIGTASQFASSSNYFEQLATLYDVVNNKHVIAYRDRGDSYHGKVVVVTADGESLSFGTPAVFNSGNSQEIDAVYADSLGKFLVQYRDYPDSSRGKVVVGTVSGTSATFGTPALYGDFNEDSGRIAWSTDDNVFVVVWDDDNNLGESRVGSVSGTTISYGTEVAFETDTGNGLGASEIGIGYTTDSKVVVAYRSPDGGSNKDSYARVGTISGTSISWGARTQLVSGTSINGSKDHEVCYDPVSGKVLITYWDETNSDYPTMVVGTISGTSISFGTPVVISSNATTHAPQMVYNAAAQKIVLYYAKNNDSTNTFSRLVTISGTTPSMSSELDITSDGLRYRNGGLSYNSADKNVLLAYPVENAGGSALVYTASYLGSNLTSSNYLGISDGAYANNTTVTVQVAGSVDDAQSGLTPGQTYYVQANGSIGTTAGSPSVIAGTAVAATKLLVKG